MYFKQTEKISSNIQNKFNVNLLFDTCCSKNVNFRKSTVTVQYVVLVGPCVKVIDLNILPESSCNKLKYSLKIAFMFLSIILKFQVPDINILLGIRKKATVFDGPWSANLVLGPRLR